MVKSKIAYHFTNFVFFDWRLTNMHTLMLWS